MNPNLVTDIRISSNPMGMTTNAGTEHLTLEETMKGIDKIWYDPTQVANIFGLSNFKEIQRITYDSNKEY